MVAAAAIAFAGCQIVSGLHDIDPAGAGGMGGQISNGGNAGMGGEGDGGEGGVECTLSSDCGVDDDCKTFSCDEGSCEQTSFPVTTVCNEGCTGDAITTGSCDGAGECSAGDEDCSPYTCDAGACTTTCATEPDCAEAAVCDPGQNRCHECGTTLPMPAPCMGMPMCQIATAQGVCDDMHPLIGGPACEEGAFQIAQMQMVNTMTRSAVLRCDVTECDAKVIDCRGPHTCVVTCLADACQNTTVRCDHGPCEVHCIGPSPMTCDGLQMDCGANRCALINMSPMQVTPPVQNCGDSCMCTST